MQLNMAQDLLLVSLCSHSIPQVQKSLYTSPHLHVRPLIVLCVVSLYQIYFIPNATQENLNLKPML
jgi:hypothetical protein